MHALELRIPPPVVAALVAAAMWALSLVTPMVPVPYRFRLIGAILLVLVGVAVASAGVVAFHRARTTVNPFRPTATSSLVTSGVYGVTRNPMYLGMALALIGWAVFLSSAWSLLGLAVFVPYMTRFQILPEERVLSRTFGAAFSDYQKRVRRWL